MRADETITVLDTAAWRSTLADVERFPPGAIPAFGEAVAGGTEGAEAGALLVEGATGVQLIPFLRTDDTAEATAFGLSCGPVPIKGGAEPVSAAALRRAIGVDHFVGYVHHTAASAYEGTKVASLHTTHVVSLGAAGGTYRKRAKRHLKTAARAGVEVRAASASEADLVVDVLSSAARAAGRRLFPDAQVVRQLAQADLALPLLAVHDGQEVAAALFLDSPLELFYWLGGTLEDARPLMPSYALIDAATQIARERKRPLFNMGSSDGLPGVAHFKEGFGAERVSYPAIAASSTHRRLQVARDKIAQLRQRAVD